MTEWSSRLAAWLRPALVDKVPRDHREPDYAFRRRRVVAAVVLVAGATLLAISLSARPGGTAFYLFTLALAATWTLGGLLSGPLHLGHTMVEGRLRRPVVLPVALGLVAAVAFLAGALVIREIPPLRDFTRNVLDYAREGSLPLVLAVTLINGVAEEIFFRGGLFAAIGRRRPVLISTAVYTVATAATGNPMLAFAALTLGFVFGLQRRASGGILASSLTHVTWSTIMVFALPPLFAK